MEKKFEMFKEKKTDKFYRIRALRDFGDVKKGDIGGYIEKEENLSHEGNCWIDNNARVYGDARVSGDAQVYNNAYVYGNAHVYCNAWVYGNAYVYGNAQVHGNVQILGNACVSGDARVYGNALVCEEHTIITGRCVVDLYIDKIESLRCQTGLFPINNKVIAYKRVRKNLTSIYDPKFQYKVGEIAEVTDYDESNESCSSGLHFSAANYDYIDNIPISDTYMLIAEIDLDDIITVQQGKIRCKRAKILGVYRGVDNT